MDVEALPQSRVARLTDSCCATTGRKFRLTGAATVPTMYVVTDKGGGIALMIAALLLLGTWPAIFNLLVRSDRSEAVQRTRVQ